MAFSCHLHLHTVYSILDGLIKLPELMNKCQEIGYKACAITDHGNLYGIHKFYDAAIKANIKPILGVEAYYTDLYSENFKTKNEKRYHITLLAQNKQGLKDLQNMVTLSHINDFYYKPRITQQTIVNENKTGNIIALSGCQGGEIAQMIIGGATDSEILEKYSLYMDFFENKFYLEIMPPETPELAIIAKRLYDLAQHYNLNIVATADCHYIKEEDHVAHDVLLAVNTKTSIYNPKRFKIEGKYWFRTPEEMEQALPSYTKALETTSEIVDMITPDYYDDIRIHMPKVKVKKDIKTLINERLDKYTQDMPQIAKQNYYKRLDKEVSIIEEHKLMEYFQIIARVIEICDENDTYVGVGRGSAAGSLLAFLLRITKVDPLKYNLLFERFLNPGRLKTGSLPDIDIDIEDQTRDKIIYKVKTEFGKWNTSSIITFNVLQDKSAIKAVARALDFDFSLSNEITKKIPRDFDFDKINDFPEIHAYYITYPNLFKIAKTIRGAIQAIGTHAAGVLIGDTKLARVIPMTKIKNRETGAEYITSQFDMKDIEKLGLIKVDLLGLTTETLLHNAIRLIEKYHKTKIDIDKINMRDKEIFECIFCKMQTMGIFQFGSEIVKTALGKMQPSSIEDLTVVNSIVRPGAKEHIDEYVYNKINKTTQYIDEAIAHVLKETHGIMIYQEQVMQICREYAGFSLEEADDIRRAIGKKIPNIINEYRDKFVRGAIINNHSPEIANEIYNQFVDFGSYAFNKSHALSYSIIAYQTAYIKYYYPLEFYITFLNLELIFNNAPAPEDKYILLQEFINESSPLGIKLIPPDINKSWTYFKKEGQNIRYGLAAIKDIGIDAAQAIVKARGRTPYKDFIDLMTRVNINRKVVIALIMSGALDSINSNRYTLVQEVDNIKKSLKKHNDKNQILMFEDHLNSDKGYGLDKSVTSFPQEEIYEKEKELTGMYISGHPLDKWKPFFKKAKNQIRDLQLMDEEDTISICCMVERLKRHKTKRGDPMCFIDVIDYSGNISCTIFPMIYKDKASIIMEKSAYYILGKVNVYHEKKSILVDKIELIMGD